MPKKERKLRSPPSREDTTSEDTGSMEADGEVEVAFGVKRDEILDNLLDELSEKQISGPGNEKCLRQLRQYLSQEYNPDWVVKNTQTLVESIQRSLKGKSNLEKRLACRLSAVLCVTLGVNSDELFSGLASPIDQLLSNLVILKMADDHYEELTDGQAQVICAASESLALMCFIYCEPGNDKLERSHFTRLSSMLSTEFPSSVHTSTLRSWSLLITKMENNAVVELFPDYAQTIADFLSSSDFDLRVAAAEALALLFEIQRNVHEADEEAESDFDIYDLDGFVEIGALIDSLNDFNADRRLTKKEKAFSRSFQSLGQTIRTGAVVPEELIIRHQKVIIDTCEQMTQLNYFRTVLGVGFHNHFEQNPLLHEIFKAYIDKSAKKPELTAVEKRMIYSTKDQTQKRAKGRANRAARNQSFLNEED